MIACKILITEIKLPRNLSEMENYEMVFFYEIFGLNLWVMLVSTISPENSVPGSATGCFSHFPSLLACENSRPSSLPAEWRFARRTSAIHRRKFHTDDVNVNFIILNRLSFAVTKGLCHVLHSHKCTS